MAERAKLVGRRVDLVLLLCWALAPCAADTGASPTISKFSTATPGAQLPAGWKPLTFPKIKQHTHYELVTDTIGTVVKATSRAAASGLVAALDVRAAQYPILEWRWKAENTLAKGDPTRKDGDDYPARIYITFKYDPSRANILQRAKYGTAKLIYGEYPPHAGLSYIWDGRTARDTMLSNTYTDRLQMIVVESGTANLGKWMTYRRNVYEDYKRAFDEEPPPISGIAIMTDTDNTGESATTFYGDIVLKEASD